MIKFCKKISSIHVYLILAFLLGLVPSISFIHMFAKDFVGYYLLSESFGHNLSYAFVNVVGYGTTDAGLQARAPLLPLLLALSKYILGNNLLGIYLPILLSRLLVTPFTFLVSSFFLPLPAAFLASSMTVFIPKLQTFSLSAWEADSFVLVFYLLAILFYLQFNKTRKSFNLFLCGLSLGLLSLVKETGFPISVGFVIAILVERVFKFKKNQGASFKNFLLLISPLLLLVTPFFLYTLVKDGSLYFSALTVDRNIKYLDDNLPVLFKTIPYYFLGIDGVNLFNQTPKSFFINSLILILYLSGLCYFIVKRNFTLILPTIFTFLALGILNTPSIGGDTPWNFELITILAFAMPLAAIFIFKGLLVIVGFLIEKIYFLKKYKDFIFLLFLVLLMVKFINNFFSKPYTQDFSGDYYINMTTVISDHRVLPTFAFERDVNGNLIVEDLSPLINHMRNEYRLEKVDIFTTKFKILTTGIVAIGLVYALVENLISVGYLSKLKKRL